MLKIAYDISILGQGHINPKAKTGVYRVVDSLFVELLKNSKIQFNPVTYNQLVSSWEIAASELYLDQFFTNPILQLEACHQNKINLNFLYRQAVKLQKKLIQYSLNHQKILYKPSLALQIPFKMLGKINLKDNFKSANFDLYHSPFYPLPNLDQYLPRLLTIYDLIPLLKPDTFTQGIRDKFTAIINSINIHQDWIICISDHTKQDFCQYTGMTPERVFVTPLAASNTFYPVTNSQLITQTKIKYTIPPEPYLLSLCTLEPRKNLKFLLQSYTQLLEQYPTLDINLVLVGVSGWKNNDIFQTIQNHPLLKQRTIITGYIPDQDLSAIYSGALAFIYPSLYEGFGLPPLEAMQCGVPVITSNTSSLPEVVGDAGIMIDPTNHDQLSQSLLDLINDSTLRQELSQKGLARAKQFSWQKCAAQTVEIYQKIL